MIDPFRYKPAKHDVWGRKGSDRFARSVADLLLCCQPSSKLLKLAYLVALLSYRSHSQFTLRSMPDGHHTLQIDTTSIP